MLSSNVTARVDGDATGVQVPRHVWLVYGEDVLDEAAVLPSNRRQPEGPFRRRIARYGEQLGPHPGCEQRHNEQFGEQLGARATRGPVPTAPLQLSTETLQSGAQATGHQGPGVPGAVAAVLREEPKAGYTGDARQAVQRHEYRGRRVRPDVLRQRLQDTGDRRGRKVRVRLPLVLRGQVPAVSNEEDDTHVPVRVREVEIDAFLISALQQLPPRIAHSSSSAVYIVSSFFPHRLPSSFSRAGIHAQAASILPVIRSMISPNPRENDAYCVYYIPCSSSLGFLLFFSPFI